MPKQSDVDNGKYVLVIVSQHNRVVRDTFKKWSVASREFDAATTMAHVVFVCLVQIEVEYTHSARVYVK